MSKAHKVTKGYVRWKDSTRINGIALAYSIRVIRKLRNITYAQACVRWLETRRQFGNARNQDSRYWLQVVFYAYESATDIVYILIDVIDLPRGAYKLRMFDVYASVGTVDTFWGSLDLPHQWHNGVLDSVNDPLVFYTVPPQHEKLEIPL